ncbi:MAG: hypothetical protein ACSLEL_04370 [Candidatus Malihini olakiniferum]
MPSYVADPTNSKMGKHLVLLTSDSIQVVLSFKQCKFNHYLQQVLKALVRSPLLNASHSAKFLLRFTLIQQSLYQKKHLLSVADNENIRINPFRDRSRIDVNIQHCSIQVVLRRIVGSAIVKMYIDSKNYVYEIMFTLWIAILAS